MRIPIAFLDRDGTIIRDHGYVADPAEVELLPRAAPAIARLNARRIPVVLVTNQSGIGRGYYSEDDFAAVQTELKRQLAIQGCALDAVYYCPHDPDTTRCACRKPGLELYELAVRRFGVLLSGALFVGDRPHDVVPARRTEGVGFLVRSGKPLESPTPTGIAVVEDLWEAVARALGSGQVDSGLTPGGHLEEDGSR